MMRCWFCGTDSVTIEREDLIPGKLVTGVDEQNGPVYYAECARCLARGPVATWAADAQEAWTKFTPPEE